MPWLKKLKIKQTDRHTYIQTNEKENDSKLNTTYKAKD